MLLISARVPNESLRLSLRNIYETFAVSFPTVVEAVQGKVTREICNERLDRWSRALVDNVGADIEVIGHEHVEAHRAGERAPAFLVMSNHQSLYDVPVLFRVFGSNLRMITKKELFSVPIFGQALAVGGFISIDRKNRAQAIESLAAAKQALHDGTNIWIAPEGTRSKTGELLPFKKGGFNLALDARLPVLPVTLSGTRDILPAKALRSHQGVRVRVTIHTPLDPEPYANEGKAGRDRLMSDVRAAIERAL